MFSLNLLDSGWLNRYLFYRMELPFPRIKPYLEVEKRNLITKNFDDYLYSVVKENGILYGCPVIPSSTIKLAKKLQFPKQRGATILLFLETLFSLALTENESLIQRDKYRVSVSYEIRLLKVILIILEYFLPRSYYRIPRNVSLSKLLKKNEPMKRALERLEINFLESVSVKGFSSLGTRQNNFAFSKLYFFLLWARQNNGNFSSKPDSFHKKDAQLREEMIFIFATLIKADNFVEKSEKNIIKKYIEQTGLPKSKQKKILKQIQTPIKLFDIQFTFKSLIIVNYLIEQLIMLSLIDNQTAWQEKKLIENLSQHLGLSEKYLEQLFCSVAEFFSIHEKRLKFLRNNIRVKQFQDYINDKVVSLVKKNLDNILKEIKETKELSELLLKATSSPLSEEEKRKVQMQLLDVARSIPAIAIFALPGGGILLPVLIKLLPFNILPSAFQDNRNST